MTKTKIGKSVAVVNHNRHPVDQLADVRGEIAKLKILESALRKSLMTPGAELAGEEYIAQILSTPAARIDPALVRKLLSPVELDAVTKKSAIVMVKTFRRTASKRR